MIHTYWKQNDTTWSVIITEPHHNSPTGEVKYDFRVVKQFSTEVEAAAWCSYLNGGARPQ